MERLICLAIGYVLGLFQTAYFYGKAHGIDIRQYGSGNSGTTNALRVLGKKAGLIVFVGDFFKCVIAVVVVRLIFGESHSDIIYLLCLYAGAGVILGHNFPFYMGFKGGKGIAATAGLICGFHIYLWIPELICFIVAFALTNYVSLGSLMVYVGLMVEMIIFGQLGVFGELTQVQLFELYGVMAFLTIMAFWKHKQNIIRLIHGEERKTYLFKKNKADTENK